MKNLWKLLLILAVALVLAMPGQPAKATTPEATSTVTITLMYDYDHDGLYEGIGEGRKVEIIREGIIVASAQTNSESKIVAGLTIGNFYRATAFAGFSADRRKIWTCDYVFEVTNSVQEVTATCFEKSFTDIFMPFLSNFGL